MAMLLKGAPVAAALNEKTAAMVEELKAGDVNPTLAILRVGERDSDLSYERGASKRCEQLGVALRRVVLPADTDNETLFAAIESLNRDADVHGILMFSPLPKHLDGEQARKLLSPAKDIDGCTDGSMAGVFSGMALGFPPCTARAAMEILDYYGIDCCGKRAAVIGRSLVVGRPAAMMLMHKNATVTVCHTKTADMPEVTKQAEIVIACTGRMESIGPEYFSDDAVVIDVGTEWNEEKGKICGDVRFDEVEPHVTAITPVPGGVGAVTTAVLLRHVVEAAKRLEA